MKYYIKHPENDFTQTPVICLSNKRPKTDIYTPRGGYLKEYDALSQLNEIIQEHYEPDEQ